MTAFSKKYKVVHNSWYQNVCKIEFSNHLWLQFLDQTQSYVVVFTVIYSDIYKILVTEWKYGISTNDIITLINNYQRLQFTLVFRI